MEFLTDTLWDFWLFFRVSVTTTVPTWMSSSWEVFPRLPFHCRRDWGMEEAQSQP